MKRFLPFVILTGALLCSVYPFFVINLKFGIDFTPTFWLVLASAVVEAYALLVLLLWKLPDFDPFVYAIAIILNGLGLAEIYRIDSANGVLQAFTNQMRWTEIALIGVGVFVFLVHDYDFILKKANWLGVAGLGLLVLPSLPIIGKEINGSRAWVHIPQVGTFQPAEFSKVLLAIFFAGFLYINSYDLSKSGRKILGFQFPRLQDIAPLLVVLFGCLAILVLQKDLGSSLLFFGLFMALIYVATRRLNWVIIGAVLFSVLASLAVKVFPHVARRIDVWLDPFNPVIYNRTGGSWQVVQGYFAMANGGLLGAGWGGGFPTLTTFSDSDFIYTALGEELGLTGLLTILLLYFILVERGFKAALRLKDGFGKLLACGISFLISLQLFVVVGGITRVVPLTGLTLPLVARGGSSLLANWAMLAFLLVITNRSRRKDVFF